MPDSGLQVRLRQEGPIPLDVEFSCAPNQLLALVGPSGAGKTTILRSIAGLYRPREGRVSCRDNVWLDAANGVHVPPHKRPVGLVFQGYALFPHMTVLRNVTTALGRSPKAARDAKAQELLSLVHLQGFDSRYPASLSGGEQQRVAVARALARSPAVLLMDEPFSAVDRRTRRKLRDELAELRKVMQIPIVMVTHDLDEAASLADRMCVIDKGETLQVGTPAELMKAPANQRVVEALDLPDQLIERISTRSTGSQSR
ncbi:ABC transporter ATP-binding protein [Bradyrhizobium sp. 157]|uniref:ABC transporter ATP-binding protein n=1 Tax=Bradyrhizobium sp. 157 TaxID=2782631 RepID=UPI001FF91A79|nr:ABC transporter ATP-binding protein [Bradyrhizobium sp. 157]MCK1636655.1 ABC transporter ATP-binding protein [Bradyrhizobium sp. 157]